MKLTVNQSPDCEETQIVIHCKTLDESVLRVMTAVGAIEKKFTGIKDGKTFVLETDHIYYFESVDKKTFIYTKDDVYETPLRLYELEDRFISLGFFLASKATVINLDKVKSLNPIISGKIEVLLENGERLFVSRRYVSGLKSLLNM